MPKSTTRLKATGIDKVMAAANPKKHSASRIIPLYGAIKGSKSRSGAIDLLEGSGLFSVSVLKFQFVFGV